MQAQRLLESQPPPRLISAGLFLVAIGQLCTAVPVAAAIGLIGLGATLQLVSRPAAGALPLAAANALIYTAIAAIAVGAEAHGGKIAGAWLLLDATGSLSTVAAMLYVLARHSDRQPAEPG